MPRKIVFFEVAGYEREALAAAALPGAATTLVAGPLDARTADLAAEAEAIAVFIYSRVDEALLARLPGLRFVATRSTGFDHLDLAALRRRGILASNVPSYGENAVAEHAFALLLALARRLPAATRKARARDFSLAGLEGVDLMGRTLGVIGVGRIGRHAARLGLGAGMRVVGHDPHEDPLLAATPGFRYAPLPELLAEADVVTVHAALTPATRHLIDRAALARMKPGALLINTARGPIVDTEALCEALDAGRLGGAGLDVFEGEELLKEDVRLRRGALPPAEARRLALCEALLARDDVVLTPHVAFFTREAVARLVAESLANLRAYLAGEPRNLVQGPA